MPSKKPKLEVGDELLLTKLRLHSNLETVSVQQSIITYLEKRVKELEEENLCLNRRLDRIRRNATLLFDPAI